jgi:2-polyprenyl-3-methyl-5-hydroxy-6-metoxy-1,4-benzoquinol methylase
MFRLGRSVSTLYTCPYCGGRSSEFFTASDWNQHSTAEFFTYYKCNVCSLIFIQRVPHDLDRYYVREQYDIPASIESYDRRANSQLWKLALLKPYVESGNMLEVGPATGEFATIARSAGFAPTLIEMDPRCCAFLRDSLHHSVVESGDPRSSIPQNRVFDAICVWQTIEHVPQFWQFLDAAAQRLGKGGIIALSTPNPASFQARILGRRWPHADAPRHLYLISPIWFKQACRSWGLRVAMVTTRDEGSIGLNYYGWYLWVRNCFGRYLSQDRMDYWAAWLTKVFRRWEHREGLGCAYVIILVKDSAPAQDDSIADAHS